MIIEEKIKEMFDAVFEPREDFMKLSKASQDILLGELQDIIVEGFKLLEKIKQTDTKNTECQCHCHCHYEWSDPICVTCKRNKKCEHCKELDCTCERYI